MSKIYPSPSQNSPAKEQLCPSLESHRQVRTALHARLYELEFLAFEQLMKSMLYKSGFLSVQLTGRTYKQGRTARGGLDLSAYSATDLSSSLTIAQVKQYRRPVSRRFVDELRGVMLRTGADQGLLLTLSNFPAAAHQAAKDSQLAPIRLISGEEILDLLMDYRLGVFLKDGRWHLDQNYLDTLQENCRCTYQTRDESRSRAATKPPRPKKPVRVVAVAASPAASSLSTKYPFYVSHTESLSQIPHRKGDEMIWGTHLMAGLSALWLTELPSGLGNAPLTSQLDLGVLAAATAIGALLPDLDAAQSKIKHLTISGMKPMMVVSQFIHRRWGHRSLLHSLPGLGLIAVLGIAVVLSLGIPPLAWQILLALLLGYASHLLADACTKSGIPLLYPNRKRFHLMPHSWRITTGSRAEDLLFVLLALAVLLFFLRHLPFAS
jgi:inner membrane protein